MRGPRRLVAGALGSLRDPLGPESAAAAVRERVRTREERFLRTVGTRWADARLGDAVREDGLDAALERLRDEGVAHRHDGSRIGLRAATSGTSTGTPTRVAYRWSLFREEAASECLLFESHGLLGAPCALWLPARPAVSGLHNVLVHLCFGGAPQSWFSQLPPRRRDAAPLAALAAAAGRRVPRPEATPPANAERVARWLRTARDRAGRAVLKTFASSAVRVAEAALREGIDLAGCTIFAGGEPLTERRVEYVRSSGAAVYGRYATTETGFVAGACPEGPSPGSMHVYADRVAVVAGADGALLFTTLSPDTGVTLLNADLGDTGRLSARPCSCALGRAGLELAVDEVRGRDKVAAGGMTVPARILASVLDEVVAAAGGPPDAYRLEEGEDLLLVVSPSVPLDDRELVRGFLDGLAAQGPTAAVAARVWRTGGIEVRREEPELGPGAKRQPYAGRAR